jgi:multiple sugar transport system permease protein
MNRKKINRTVIYHILTFSAGVIMIYPLIWMVMSSFKESSTVFSTATTLIPEHFVFANYLTGWQGFSKTTFGIFIKNTFLVSALAMVFTCVSSLFVAYGIARLSFPGKKIIFSLILLTMMLPTQVMMIPQYLWYNKLGWLNSYKPLTIPYLFGINGFFVYLVSNFIHGIPRELDASAKIDGCSFYSIFTKIICPLTTPALGTVAIFSFINNWNDYMSPLLYLRSTKKYTVSLALKLFSDPTSVSDFGAMFAMSTVSLIPVLVIFIFMQRYIIEGVSTSGIKG